MNPLNLKAFGSRVDGSNLKQECGVTKISLDNALHLLSKYGYPERITIAEEKDEWYVFVTLSAGVTHKFSGFSWGYGGEGPHGFMAFLTALNLHELAAEVPSGQFKNMPTSVAYDGSRMITLLGSPIEFERGESGFVTQDMLNKVAHHP